MSIKEKLMKFKQELNDYFIINDKEKEWVDIEILNVNEIDISIVSDVSKGNGDIKKFINKKLDELNDEINEKQKFKLRLFNFNTIDEAEYLGIIKPIRRSKNVSSFAELIDYNLNEECEDINKIEDKKINSSKIISFYSYKGGVGRTIALIQTAYLLAKEGKRVLLIDLDIEAPSFYNIFKDTIKKEFGIVDYLYEELYSDENEITLSKIMYKLDLNLSGEIFFIPAGILSKNYVKKLDKLKEKRIYENKYIQKLIKNSEQQYDIDYTLMDSRTGINNWGALSLIDIAHEVMLFAYPNKENIEGLKLIKELIDDHKKTTIVLSRIDASKEGNKIAQKLFKQLNLNQEYISIPYNPTIAMAMEFPVESSTEAYSKISNFILEAENNIKIEKKLESKQELFIDVLKKVKQIDKVKFNSEYEKKVLQDSNSIIICERDIFDDHIVDLLGKDVDLRSSHMLNINNDGKVKLEVSTNFFKESTQKILERIDELVKYSNGCIEGGILIYLDDFYDMFKYSEQYKVSKEDMPQALLTIVQLLNNNILSSDVRKFKLVMDFKQYNSYRKIVDEFDTNILKLSWKALDEQNSENVIKEIEECIRGKFSEEVKPYISKNILGDEEAEIISNSIEFLLKNRILEKSITDVVLGKRIYPNTYSKEIKIWIYEQLKSKNKLDQNSLIKFIIKAAEIEIENIKDKKEFYRIISFDSMKKSMDII